VSQLLTQNQQYALDYLYSGGDETVECASAAWVITRYPQLCLGILHVGDKVMPKGSRMVLERAKVEGRFGSCYTCGVCIKAAQKERSK
jgi:hypothetical protein